MKTRRLVVRCLVTLVLATVVFSGPALSEQPKLRIAVIDFDTEAIQGEWHFGWSYNNLARAAADNLASELVKTGKFTVIERQQLEKVLGEQDLGTGGRINPATAAQVGKVTGAQLLVVGSVTVWEVSEKGGHVPQIGSWKGLGGVGVKVVTGKAELTARLVDSTTGEILGAYDGKGSHSFGKGEFAGADLGTDWNVGMASKILAGAVDKLAKDISSRTGSITPSTARGTGIEGKVAKVGADGVYINLGSAAGLKVGDKFEVRHVGEQIKDPDTGEVLGGDEGAAGTIEVVKIVGDKLSLCRSVGAGDYKTGDRVVMK